MPARQPIGALFTNCHKGLLAQWATANVLAQKEKIHISCQIKSGMLTTRFDRVRFDRVRCKRANFVQGIHSNYFLVQPEMGVTFINTDLILKARFDLGPLGAALERRGLFLLSETVEERGVWTATLESNLSLPTPEQSTKEILEAIESLREEERIAWEDCFVREFDFGYRRGGEAFETTVQVTNSLLARIATAGASLAITIYEN